MISLHHEWERRMDLRFGILAAALVNAIANPKSPVTPADVYPSLATPVDTPDPERLAAKAIAALGVET